MGYQVIARKWRPRRFDEVVGQEHITVTLKNALMSGRIAQCYLLCGPRGVGKTTSARILAKALNCAQRDGADPCNSCTSCTSIADATSMNVLEIDGASNNSVDDVRELREVVRYVPTEGTYRIFIIDEVHMLSTAAFNALLKTLEEPPERVVFIFATTEVQEVPETILSRCQRFNFRRISAARIAALLTEICQAENISADEDALFLLADRADGALRDAQSLLDQVASFNDTAVTAAAVRQVLGLVDRALFFELGKAFSGADAGQTLGIIGRLVDAGGDIEEFVHGLVEYLRHLLYTRVQGSAATLEVAETERPHYEEMATQFAAEDLLRMLQGVMDLSVQLRHSAHPRFRVEMALTRMTLMARAVDVGVLLQRLTVLEGALKQGALKGPTAAATRAPVSAEPPSVERPPVEPVGAAETPRPQSSRPAPLPAAPPLDIAPEPLATPPVELEVEAAVAPEAVSGQETVVPPVAESGIPTTPADIKGAWDQLVQAVRQKQPTLGIFLQGAVLLGVDEQRFKLGFAAEDRFPMSQVLKHRGVVEAWCLQHWGQRLRLECVVQEVAGQESATGALAAPSLAEDDTVRSVLDTFDGELL